MISEVQGIGGKGEKCRVEEQVNLVRKDSRDVIDMMNLIDNQKGDFMMIIIQSKDLKKEGSEEEEIRYNKEWTHIIALISHVLPTITQITLIKNILSQ